MAAATRKASSGKAPPPDTDTGTDTDTDTDAGAAEAETAGSGLSRAVVWTGIALGTTLAVLVISDGARLRIGGMPGWLGVSVGAVIVWALIVLAAVTAAELTRRHHKTAGKYAIRQGKRGALATGRRARRHGRSLITRAAAWAGPRWQGRRSAGPGSDPAAVPPRRVCAACGNPEGGKFGPLVTYQEEEGPVIETFLIHRAHFDDPSTGYHGQPYDPDAGTPAADHPSPTDTTPGGTMTQPARPVSRITPDRRARRSSTQAGGSVPSAWGPVVGQAADFEPESDGHLLDWMAGQVTGMAAYAEALIEAYETGVSTVGIDPKGLAALHDVADAAAHAAETMSGARTKFSDHYELPREFAANGGVMTHDGRWVTGEGG
jgi:hypothetical protein